MSKKKTKQEPESDGDCPEGRKMITFQGHRVCGMEGNEKLKLDMSVGNVNPVNGADDAG